MKRNEYNTEMVTEVWRRWIPLEGVVPRMTVKNLTYNKEQLVIDLIGSEDDSLSHPNSYLQLEFIDPPLAWRTVDESFRLSKLANVSMKEPFPWPLHVSENSRFLDWFKRESMGVVNLQAVKHLVVSTVDDVIDVLIYQYPRVRFMSVSV